MQMKRHCMTWDREDLSIFCHCLQQVLQYLVVRTEPFQLVGSLAWEAFEIVPHVSSAFCLHCLGSCAKS